MQYGGGVGGVGTEEGGTGLVSDVGPSAVTRDVEGGDTGQHEDWVWWRVGRRGVGI